VSLLTVPLFHVAVPTVPYRVGGGDGRQGRVMRVEAAEGLELIRTRVRHGDQRDTDHDSQMVDHPDVATRAT
jgi:hypothetical protein